MIKNLLLFFLSLIFAILIVEAGLRINGIDPWKYKILKKQPVINKFDKIIGWSPKPGIYDFEAYSPNGKDFKFTILEDGSRYSGLKKNTNNNEIVFLGGSVTQGWAVDDKENFTWYIQNRLSNYNIKNYGVSGYGTYQSYLMLDRVLKKKNKIKYIIYSFIHPHEIRNIGSENWLKILTKFSPAKEVFFPYASLDKGGNLIKNEPISYVKLPLREQLSIINKIEKRIMKIRMYSKNKDKIVITKKIIEKMISLADANGSKFIMVNISDDSKDLKPYKDLILKNGAQPINCAKKPNKYLTVEGEGHPNKKMHQLYAECILKELKINF
tara:strand:+ start:891 stop:1868 length:978 start_codon:yes stop_codon:yes gene_type:complete